MADLLFKKLSYEIMGCCFAAYNQLGYGLRESNYQSAIEKLLGDKKIKFQRQLYVPLKINEQVVGKYYLDILVEDKVAIELKVGDHFFRKDIEQLYSYLKSKKLKLGILVNFTKTGIKSKRILNVHRSFV